MRRRSSPRRALLAGLALALLAGPAAFSGCAADFAPISRIDGLRVLAVSADQPYAAPGAEVTFKMTYVDGLVDPEHPDAAGKRPITVTWLGGCFDPVGDQYYACYDQLGTVLQDVGSGSTAALGLIGLGPKFTLKLPDDLVSRRPEPAAGLPHYGIAYVFFAACAGTLKPVPPGDAGLAGSFPLGCFDDAGNQLGSDSFVAGFTQVYAFADGRTNANPHVDGMKLEKKTIPFETPPTVKRCKVSEDTRLGPPACGQGDPTSDCRDYEIDVMVPDDVAEVDPDGDTPDGKKLHEAVWVDYFAEGGDFDADVALVSDATTGIQKDHSVKWLPPPDPGPVKLWAVVHDARGGQTVISRTVTVE